MKYYLAYGSNLNARQMTFRCPGARAVGTAILKNYQLLFRGSKTGSYLTIEYKKGAVTPVAVWAVGPENEKALDIYEGFPTFYYKKTLRGFKFTDLNGRPERVDAFLYIMHEDRPLGLPTQYYVDVCLDGYDDFGFDPEKLWAAVDRTAENLEITITK